MISQIDGVGKNMAQPTVSVFKRVPSTEFARSTLHIVTLVLGPIIGLRKQNTILDIANGILRNSQIMNRLCDLYRQLTGARISQNSRGITSEAWLRAAEDQGLGSGSRLTVGNVATWSWRAVDAK